MARLMNLLTHVESTDASDQITGKCETLWLLESESAVLGTFKSKRVAEAAADEVMGHKGCCTMLGDAGPGSVVYAVHDPGTQSAVYVRRFR